MKRVLLLTLICLTTVSAFAAEFSVGEDHIISETDANEDYIYAGESLTFSADCDDLYFVGEDLKMTGSVGSSLTAFGSDLIIEGPVGNNAHLAGREVIISGPIRGTVFAAGENVTLSKGVTLDGTLTSAGRDILINGSVNDDVILAGSKIIINGPITGNALIRSGKLEITANGSISGSLDYSTEFKLTPEEEARVGGSVKYTVPADGFDFQFKKWGQTAILFAVIFGIIMAVGFLLLGLLLLTLPVFKTIETQRSPKRVLRTGLWGLIPVFVYPVLIVLSALGIIIFGLGLPFLLFLVFATVPLYVLAVICGAYTAGQLIARLLKWNITSRHLLFMIGLVPFFILGLIPVINFFSGLVHMSLGAGVLLEGLFQTKFGKEAEA